MTPVDAIWLFLVKTQLLPATSWLPTLPPCRSASGIDYPSKKLSKMVGYSASLVPQLAIHSTVGA